MNKTLRDSIVVGLALFATFFGAGNLIFPPFLGLQSGSDWLAGIAGFVASGVIMPASAIYIVSYAGGSVENMTKKLHPKFSQWLLLVIMLFSTFIAIPRTGAVTHELGVQALFPSVAAAPIIIVFFILAYYFVNDKNKVIDKIGMFLTPVLVIILVAIIIKGVITPAGAPAETGVANVFVNALLGGYQTGDLFVSYMVAGIFIADLISKGYVSEKERKRMVGTAAIVAIVCLFIIYAGLLFLGASVSGIYPQDIDRPGLLLSIVETLLGRGGLYGLGIAVALACLTTAIGLTTSVAQFFDGLTKGKLSYKASAALVCIIGAVIALLGVDKIVFISTPIFLSIYPTCIVVMIVGIFHKHLPNTASYKGAVAMTILVSLVEALLSVADIPFLAALIGMIPLSSAGFTWILPAIFGFTLGALIGKSKEQVKINEVA